MSVLRHYQQSAIEQLREKIRAGLKRVVLVAATGSGKTRIAAEIIMNAVKNGKRVAFVCNRIELVKQSVAAFEKLGIKCGVMQGQNTWEANAQVVVCSVQTMARRKFNMFCIMIHDECHVTSASKAYHKVIESHNNVIHIGLTATPWSKGMSAPKKWLNGEPLWQDIVVAASIPLLIEQGFLVDCDIYAPGEPDLTGVKVVNGDYDKTQLGQAVDKTKLVGDIVKHWFRLAAGEQTVVFAVNVAHSKHITEEFMAQGVDARHVDGYMTEEERRPIIDAFRRGEFQILSNCSMLAEGFDVPATSCCILARPTKSLIRYIQMVGRCLRPYEGKQFAIVIDHSGVVRRLGWPTEELPYDLDDGKPKEAKPKENLPKVCPSCFAVFKKSLRKCPVCQFEPKPMPKAQEVEDGQLVQLSKKATKFSPADKQAIYSAWLGWVKEKGFKEGAAYHRYKEMIGCYPNNQLDKVPGPMVESVRDWITHENIKYAKSHASIFWKAA
jgi:superfamily II DNA or RNA helicase